MREPVVEVDIGRLDLRPGRVRGRISEEGAAEDAEGPGCRVTIRDVR
jgi:hypothetical protein